MKKEIIKEYEKIIKMAKENIELVKKETLTDKERVQLGANNFDITASINHIRGFDIYKKRGNKS